MYVPGVRSPSFLGRMGRLGRRPRLAGYRPNQARNRTYGSRTTLQGYGNGYVFPVTGLRRRRGLGQDWSDDTETLDPDLAAYAGVPTANYDPTTLYTDEFAQNNAFSTLMANTTPATDLVTTPPPSLIPGVNAPVPVGLSPSGAASSIAQLTSAALSTRSLNPTAQPGFLNTVNPSLGISNGTLVLGLGAVALFAMMSGGRGRR